MSTQHIELGPNPTLIGEEFLDSHNRKNWGTLSEAATHYRSLSLGGLACGQEIPLIGFSLPEDDPARLGFYRLLEVSPPTYDEGLIVPDEQKPFEVRYHPLEVAPRKVLLAKQAVVASARWEDRGQPVGVAEVVVVTTPADLKRLRFEQKSRDSSRRRKLVSFMLR